MRAIRFDTFGDPSVLEVVEIAAPRRHPCGVNRRARGESAQETRHPQLRPGASVGVNYMAAWRGLEAAGLRAGETVLLIGAGGGVGGAAAQIARRLGPA